jgi:hypothetical protein
MAPVRCIPLADVDLYKLKSLPSGTLDRNAIYIIEEDSTKASMYVTDKLGKPRTVAFNGQGIVTSPQELVKLYQIDVEAANYYYYGYQYETYWRIVRVDQIDVTASSIASSTNISTFLTNWANRETLTYI